MCRTRAQIRKSTEIFPNFFKNCFILEVSKIFTFSNWKEICEFSFWSEVHKTNVFCVLFRNEIGILFDCPVCLSCLIISKRDIPSEYNLVWSVEVLIYLSIFNFKIMRKGLKYMTVFTSFLYSVYYIFWTQYIPYTLLLLHG